MYIRYVLDTGVLVHSSLTTDNVMHSRYSFAACSLISGSIAVGYVVFATILFVRLDPMSST